MAKKIFIVLGVLILIIITLSLFSSYKSYKISKEKCGEISRQQGRQFVYIEGAGCVAKEILEEQKKYEKEQIKEKGYDEYYKTSADKSISANIKGVMVLNLENYKEVNGSYAGYVVRTEGKIDNKYCSSEATIIISPDGKQYVIYQPLCSDKEKIFCLDSIDNTTVKELPKNSISSIEQNYSCK